MFIYDNQIKRNTNRLQRRNQGRNLQFWRETRNIIGKTVSVPKYSHPHNHAVLYSWLHTYKCVIIYQNLKIVKIPFIIFAENILNNKFLVAFVGVCYAEKLATMVQMLVSYKRCPDVQAECLKRIKCLN